MHRMPIALLLVISTAFMPGENLRAQGRDNFSLLDQKNLVAWCIVPFDSRNRTPAERIEMLQRLKFSQYAYDWRHQHLDSFASEIELSKKEKITMMAVWIWIDKNADKPGQLSEDNERMLKILSRSGLKTQLWVGFNHNYFDQRTDAEKLAAGVEMIRFLRKRTDSFVTTVGLYNHGDWFGDAYNQVKMAQSLNDAKVGIVYNFHHGHTQIDDFDDRLAAMKPYLRMVNIDGMKVNGPQILPVGNGDKEKDMLSQLLKSGYSGPIGILGHIETEDVEVVLQRNLEGLRRLAATL